MVPGFIRKYLSQDFCIIATGKAILYGVSMAAGDQICPIRKRFLILCRNGWKLLIATLTGWCPLNETWDYKGKKQNNLILENIYRLTKALDTTRPCIDSSGNFHVVTDIYDLHNYRQDVKAFSDCYKDFPQNTEIMEEHPDRQHYKKGQPLFISEYGGIKWDTSLENKEAWGYGEAPKTEEEFIERYRGLTSCLLNHPYIMAFCYTQLYDVEQETNGLYDYDRNPKFDVKKIYEINCAKAEIEGGQ